MCDELDSNKVHSELPMLLFYLCLVLSFLNIQRAYMFAGVRVGNYSKTEKDYSKTENNIAY